MLWTSLRLYRGSVRQQRAIVWNNMSCQGGPVAAFFLVALALCAPVVAQDSDGDGIPDGSDNCPLDANPQQEDTDSDGKGDACDPPDPDTDGDGLTDNLDNCPFTSNANQTNSDGDSPGDACDVCPFVDNESQADSDGDNIGNDCDNCPGVSNAGQADQDLDGIGDACDTGEGVVVINEVLYDQQSGGQEFVELYVVQGPVDLAGWTLEDQDEQTLSLSSFPCSSLIVDSGDLIVLWQGSGTSDCTGSVREIFVNVGTFLQRTGDDLVLRNDSGECEDFVQFEAGPQVGARPADCAWSGTNPSNDDVGGVSISRFDGSPFLDTDSGQDWERSGKTDTSGPASPGQLNGGSNNGGNDLDRDTVDDGVDNCPTVPNPTQTNSDGDSHGDACDVCPSDDDENQLDTDGDNVGNACDNCPSVSNPSQIDTDGDGTGDACETGEDSDGDGVPDATDNCPDVSNSGQTDLDNDGLGDPCDGDVDGDGVLNTTDNCPTLPNPGQDDDDLNGVGDVCDEDVDGDGVPNTADNCPTLRNPGQDDDNLNGVGDLCEWGGLAFIRGDANRDNRVDLGDPVRLLGFLFRGDSIFCRQSADANGDGGLDLADPVWMLNYLFRNGPPPPRPFPNPGFASNPGSLTCDA